MNITDVKNCGEIIINNMEGTSPLTYSFKRIIQTVQMPTSSDILNKKDAKVSLDPELLFQRLITVSSDDDQNDALKYQLAQYPMAPFNDAGFMRDSKKNELGNHIAEQYTIHDVILDISSESWKKVVDGGMLLHKLPWQIGNSFLPILDSYVKYVDGMGKGIHITFDGYLSSNTKDHCHIKRNPIQSNAIELTSSMLLDFEKDLFLSYNKKKQMFIDLLGIRLISAGHNVFQYTDDADTNIADRAIELAEEFTVCVHASDTDIFILFINKLKLSTPNTVYLIHEKSNRTINMTTLIQVIPEAKRRNILLSHAMSGCHTKSSLFGIGKTKLFKVPYWNKDLMMPSYSRIMIVLSRTLLMQVNE